MTLRASLAAVAIALAAPAAHALLYTAPLSGTLENPPNASPGSGFVSVDFDTDAHLMLIEATFSGLLSPSTVAHIHCCTTPDMNIGVATTTPTFPDFPAGVLSGSYSMSFDTLATTTYSANFLAAAGGTAAGAEAALKAGLDGGLAYFNVHSEMFPGGELRGNLAPIPEPSQLALMALGLGLFAVALRRRR